MQHITIGNFYNNLNTDTLRTSNNVPNIDSYYYIDDILVENTCLNHSKDTTICFNSSVNLYTYSNNFLGWAEASTPSVIISTDTSITVSPLQNTNYLVYGTCDTNQISVIVKPPPEFNLGNDTIMCPNESFNLSSNVLSSYYLWSDSSTNNGIQINGPGIYWLELIENNCLIRDSITISYHPEQIFSFMADTVLFCPGDTLAFEFNLVNANYQWSNNSTNHAVSITSPQNLQLTVEQNDCLYTDSVEIYTPPPPILNLGKNTTLCEKETLLLTASSPYSTYLWQDGSTDAELNVNEAGTYWVNVENCVASSDTILIETENCECVLFLPNSFTPDESGINDEISAVTNCPVDYFQFIIYNRWGKVVFQSNNINEFWDGTVKNELTNTACFSYSLRYSFADDAFVHTKFGRINMIY